MHKLYCIMGRTASGKSTISRQVSKELGLKVLKSYTTRTMRDNETENNSDHIFIKPEEVINYPNKAAYTERVGYCSFATEEQLFENDIYIINPNGFKDLKNYTKDMEDIELVGIMINVPYLENVKRAKKRGDYKTWNENYISEDDEFKNIEGSGLVHYYVLNDGTIKSSVKKLISIIEKEENK